MNIELYYDIDDILTYVCVYVKLKYAYMTYRGKKNYLLAYNMGSDICVFSVVYTKRYFATCFFFCSADKCQFSYGICPYLVMVIHFIMLCSTKVKMFSHVFRMIALCAYIYGTGASSKCHSCMNVYQTVYRTASL